MGTTFSEERIRVPEQPAEQSPLFDRLGGMQGIKQVVDRFYDKIMADDRVKGFFEGVDMERQRRHQTAFVAFAVGGPKYSGRSMEQAHRGMNLQPAHFNAVVEDLVTALKECGVGTQDVDKVVETVGTLRGSILYQ